MVTIIVTYVCKSMHSVKSLCREPTEVLQKYYTYGYMVFGIRSENGCHASLLVKNLPPPLLLGIAVFPTSY